MICRYFFRFLFLATAAVSLALSSIASAAIPTVATVDPMLMPPIVYDSSAPGFSPGGPLDFTTNGGFNIGGLEVLGPGAVYAALTDAGLGADTLTLQLTGGAPAAVGLVGAPVPFELNSRGFDLTRNPVSGLLGVVGTLSPAAGGPSGVIELDPAGVAAPVVYGTSTTGWTTSGLTYDADGATARISTDGVDGGLTPALPGGYYTLGAGAVAETLIASSFAALPTGLGAFTDDHIIRDVDGAEIVVGDGSHDIWDASVAGAVSLLIDLDLVGGLSLFAGGVRAADSPVDGDIFIGYGLGGTDVIRVDEFGGGASTALIGFDTVRDIDFGPSTLAASPTGVSLYITEFEFGTGVNTIWEVGIIPEPSSAVLALAGLMAFLCSPMRRAGR